MTVRLRLTALYGGLFVLAGAVLLTITYLLLAQALAGQQVDALMLSRTVHGVAVQATPARPASGPTSPEMFQLATKLQTDFRSATLRSLLQQGGVALGAVAIAGVWAAWFAAGRTLRPLAEITATARRIADRNLHERIAMTGPRDELRRLADTVDDMLARLDAAFAAQRRFAANASHELRTPLAINRTLIEVALSHPDPSPDVRRLGETLLVINARHERLIDGLLLLARGDQDLVDPVPVDLAEITRHVASLHEVAEVTVSPSPMAGDPVLLERMVQNLVENAVIHGRSVAVTCEPGRLTVTNSGPVIAAYEIPRLFEPFQRLTDRVGSATGTGLGLSIVRAVARAHGGTAVGEPGPDGGLTVTVEFLTSSA
ncbi:ATP-binding protein [Actinoplanes sp. NBRC 103695]|uniref:sensor histidine kinase n=1 Tax=Actinoplanes sp. NBRC 103695 TaxID=3032202 RepID=UPI0024A48A98|nr:ATP-binding protein [Actinoplanes sp. NBRC 103695]GLY99488.1 two-component sensor histidine kinase [Actinoplanes sp. NBRC 103695]